MGRSIKRKARKRQIKWMGASIGIIILLGSCRTIDCGCPMAQEEKTVPSQEKPMTVWTLASPDSDGEVGLLR